VARYTMRPAREWLTLYFAKRRTAEPVNAGRPSAVWKWLTRLVLAAAFTGILYAAVHMIFLLAHLTGPEVRSIFLGAGATLLRVAFTLFLAGLWTIPVGVMIGLKPKLSAIAQPIVQVAASVPATALFPIILLLLIQVGGGLGVGSIILLLLGTQWYLLFNVIAGATAIPTDLKEVCNVYSFERRDRWQQLFLPGIFPFLITGFVTASGGAWNASIIAEYFHFRGHTYMTTGLGAVISNATDTGNFRVLLAATIVMAAMVVTINRLLWRRMYNLAATRFKLEN
jgi:NitT/TauT family transport system permease protein